MYPAMEVPQLSCQTSPLLLYDRYVSFSDTIQRWTFLANPGFSLNIWLGSGITIFVVQSTFYSNISITLDESWSTIATIHSIPDGEGINFNVMLYNVQALAGVNHTLDIALLDYIFNNGTRIGSDIHFDYAAINDTLLPVISSSPSSLLPSSSSPSSGSGSHSQWAF